MDNLSEYIPLLIIIASVIISIVRKINKQQTKEFELPEEIFEFEEPQSYIPETPAPKKKQEVPVSRKIPTLAKKEPANYKKVVETPYVDEYESIDIDLSEPEEMKKAIVYSEIFNRKDF